MNKRFKRAVLDIETNSLLNPALDFLSKPLALKPHVRLWCIAIRDFDNLDDVVALSLDECTEENLKELLKETEEIIFHNGIGFDMVMLQLFNVLKYKVGYESDTIFGDKPITFVDTLLLSKMLRPDRFGGHSVEAWGRTLGVPKIDFHEFEEYSEEMVTYCITPDMRLLDTSLNWRPADTYSVGDVILGFDEEVQPGRHGRRYKNAVIEIINEDHQEVFEVLLESGKILKVTNEHRFLVSTNNHGFNGYHWVETKDLQPKEQFPTNFSQLPCLLPVYDQDMSYDSGWLGGMFDGEGSIVRGKIDPPGLTIAQRPTPTLEKIERIMDQFDISRSKRYVKKDSDCISLKVLGGLSEVYRTLSICRPERLISKLNFDTFGRLEMRGRSFNDPVVSIRSIGIQKILKIQTSSSTFMCEGYPMHNCKGDTLTQAHIYQALLEEMGSGWEKIQKAYRMEIKLMDLTVRQELRGFHFDKPLAEKTVKDFTELLESIRAKVDPLLPERPLNKGEQKLFIPPKLQFKSNGDPSAVLLKFVERVGGTLEQEDGIYILEYEGNRFTLPYTDCIKTAMPGSIDNLDYLKGFLLDLGWDPIEWKERDLTKDSSKNKLSGSKLDDTILRYIDSTLNGPYKKYRLDLLGTTEEKLTAFLFSQKDKFSIKVPVSPLLRIGTEKKLCDNLKAMGEEADFALDVIKYLTFKHRKNSLAGGKSDEEGEPLSGYLSNIREDGRIGTPADTCGANGN